MKIKDQYIGDGVYASFDGYHVVLDLRGQDATTRIALEPQVIDALNAYVAFIAKQIKRDEFGVSKDDIEEAKNALKGDE